MKSPIFVIVFFSSLILPRLAHAQKDALPAAIDRRSDASWVMARATSQWAEPGCQATRSAKLVGAKAFMVRAGLFSDCDVALHWHPSSANQAGDRSCLARIAVKFRYHGIASHAAGAPEKGRSALDAVQLTCHASELLREHVPDFTRIHHTITHGGGMAPNVVPEFAEVFFYVRHPKAEMVSKIYPRLVKCAEAGALATETRLETPYLG